MELTLCICSPSYCYLQAFLCASYLDLFRNVLAKLCLKLLLLGM